DFAALSRFAAVPAYSDHRIIHHNLHTGAELGIASLSWEVISIQYSNMTRSFPNPPLLYKVRIITENLLDLNSYYLGIYNAGSPNEFLDYHTDGNSARQRP
ncbi:MAG: hypothetical protein ONB31_11740, partial [candidate division KSB1 bacterium]|nr:hypothetical protein [candidate division KSB1 bacterium]